MHSANHVPANLSMFVDARRSRISSIVHWRESRRIALSDSARVIRGWVIDYDNSRVRNTA
jgi:hypothetical protein